MGKKLLLFSLLSILTFSGFSQNRDADSPLRFGLNINPFITWNKAGKNFKPDGIKVGFEYGLNIHYYFIKNVGIETGLYLNHQGAKYRYNRYQLLNDGADTAYYNYNFNLNTIYVKLPIMLRFRTNQLGPVYLYGNFGIDLSVPISAKLKFSGQDRNVQFMNDSTINYAEDAYKLNSGVSIFRMGLSVGGGIEYPIKDSFSFTAGILFNYGFLNILKDDLGTDKKPFVPTAGIADFRYRTPDREDIRSQYFGLSVGVLF